MIIVCCACKKILGEKEPLDDRRETHTYCEGCKPDIVCTRERYPVVFRNDPPSHQPSIVLECTWCGEAAREGEELVHREECEWSEGPENVVREVRVY